MTALSLKQVEKSYGGHPVIHGIDLEVAAGEFVVLVGPSGCGKSTLLRMIAGLEAVTGGDLILGGVKANDIPPQRRNIAMVFQSYALYPHMTARGNIAYGPRLRGEPKPAVEAKVGNAARILNLVDYLDRQPRQLSGGQRQRVAMGRAIVRDPVLSLFDEPLSNLDAKLRVQMRAEIKSLHRRLGNTVVYVTHDQVEAMTMADRIVIMNAGRIEQVGTPIDLYDRPANTFVAEFLGSPSMSFFAGRIDPDGGDPAVRLASGGRIGLPASFGGHERDVVVGVRPEGFKPAQASPVLSLAVDLVEPTGADTILHGSVGSERAVAMLVGRHRAVPGDVVGLDVDAGAVHLFDAATGLRM